MRGVRWNGVVPPGLLGAALAVTGKVAVGLLLYEGPGFLPALSVVLGCLFGGLGLGVLAGVRRRKGDEVELARQRWFQAVLAFGLAAVFAGAWEIFQGFGATALTQGVGLAFLAALPAYAGGAVLGGMSREGGGAGSAPLPGVGAPLGAALGVLVTGHALFPTFSPAAVLLLCLVTVSAAALVHGRRLDELVTVRPGPSDGEGRVRMERWVGGNPGHVRTAVLQGGRLRILVGEGGAPIFTEEVVAEEFLRPRLPEGGRVVVLGGGMAVLAHRLVASLPRLRADVMDGDRELLDPMREALPRAVGLPQPREEAAGSVRCRPVPVWEALSGSPVHLPIRSFDAAIVEWRALDRDGRPGDLSPGRLLRLRSSLKPGGILAILPVLSTEGREEHRSMRMAVAVAAAFSRTALYAARGDLDPRETCPASRFAAWRAARPDVQATRAVLVAGPAEPGPWPDRIREFLRVDVSPDSSSGGP